MTRLSKDDRKNATIPKLSDKEWEILKPLWDKGPMAARDIYREVPRTFGWAYKTVKTMLSRLVKKGAITYDQVGNSYLYRAAYSREQMTRAATRSFVQRVFDGALNPFLAYFAEGATPEEVKRLKRELAKIEREKLRTDDEE